MGVPEVISAAVGAAAMVACAVRARRELGRYRRAWTAAAAAAALLGVAALAAGPSSRSAALAFAVAAVAAALAFPTPFVPVARLAIDALLVSGSTVLVGWALALEPVVRTGAGPLDLAVSVAQLAVVAAVAVTLTRGPRAPRVVLACAGLGLASVLHLAAIRLGAAPAVAVAGLPLVALGAASPLTPAAERRTPAGATRTTALLPYAPFLVAMAVVAQQRVVGGTVAPVPFWTALALVVLVVVRQAVAVEETASVAGRLEAKVEARSADVASERERVRAHARELQASRDVVLAGVGGTTVEETVERIVAAISSAFGYESVAVALLERSDEGEHLVGLSGTGAAGVTVGVAVPLGGGLWGRVAATAEPHLAAEREPAEDDLVPDTRSELCVPMSGDDGPLGVLYVQSAERWRFGSHDLSRLVRLAPQIGLVISNAKLLAQERATTERLRELDSMRRDFVAITSHELRTPLTSISGFIKTIRRPDRALDAETTARFMEVIDRQADRLIRLVEDLLVAARIEAGAVHVDWRRVDVRDMLQALVAELEPEKARRVELQVASDVPAVVTDPHRLAQVLRNLIDNGLKFSGEDSVVRLGAFAREGAAVFEVADRGPGVAAEELERIFQPFLQLEDAMNREHGGFGLGLYITKRLVDALGGSINVVSEPGAGTRFRVTLPTRPSLRRQLTLRRGGGALPDAGARATLPG